MDYGPAFDQELEKLLWEFLIRLDQLLPVPNLAQVASAFVCFFTNHLKTPAGKTGLKLKVVLKGPRYVLIILSLDCVMAQ